MLALRSFPVVTDQRSYLSMKMNSRKGAIDNEQQSGHLYVLSMP